jgi:hypothetical protein
VTPEGLLARRLANQLLAAAVAGDPAQVVTHLGAVQAQEYGQSLWAVGLRTRLAGAGTVEAAIERGTIVRTWPMRGTIHLVPAADARWMLELLAGRRIRQMAGVYQRIGLTDAVFDRSAEVVAGALRGGRRVRRKDLYALLTERAPGGRKPGDALAELATRYFTSHGPATARDFGWWSGLKLSEVREAIGLAGPALAAEELDGETYWQGAGPPAGTVPGGVHLLPAFDEYTVGYADRGALVREHPLSHGDLLNPVMVLDGRAVGLWRRAIGREAVTIQLAPFGKISGRERECFQQAAERYAAFLGMPAEITQAAAAEVRRQRRQ